MLVDSQKDPILYSDAALLGCDEPITGFEPHAVLGTPIEPPYPPHYERAIFGMGCFWGAERRFWEREGVYVTAAGYAGGITPNPTYEEVCRGTTGHAEVAKIEFDPTIISYEKLKCMNVGVDSVRNMWNSRKIRQTEAGNRKYDAFLVIFSP